MATQVTQCPKCKTSFRVTEAQLNIARGAVRCGSCLHIFNAPDHWLGTSKAKAAAGQKPAAAMAKARTAPAPRQTAESQSLEAIFDDHSPSDRQPGHHQSSSADTKRTDPTEMAEIDRIFATTAENAVVSDEDLLGKPSANSSLINTDDDLLFDDDTGLDDTDSEPDTGFSDNLMDLDTADDDEEMVFMDLDELGAESDSDGDQDGWARKLMEEELMEEEPPEQQDEADGDADRPLTTETATSSQQLDELLSHFENQPSEDDDYSPTGEHSSVHTGIDTDFIEDELVLDVEPMSADRELLDLVETFENESLNDTSLSYDPSIDSKADLLAGIEPAPVEIRHHQSRGGWRKLLWLFAILLALLLLLSQYVYFNFERLARDSQYRPLLSQACQWIGCEIPPLQDVNKVQSSNLVVRGHPKIDGALVVDAIITNRASFQQRFPRLQLQFTDLAGEPVASRSFTPAEYLAGELAGSVLMPVRQPVRISLEILDPGNKAVNYQLDIQAAGDS